MQKVVGFDSETIPEKHIERLLRNVKGVKKRPMTLFPSFYQLEAYCQKHGIDRAEIDHKLTIEENLEILKGKIEKAYTYDISNIQLKETDYIPEDNLSYFVSQEFYSAQFYSPELFKKQPEGIYLTDSQAVNKIFSNRTQGAIFLANNAEFDFAVLAKILDKNYFQIRCLYNGSRFLYGKIIHGKHCWKIIDLMNIFSMWSLAKIGKFVGLDKLEKPEYLGKRAPITDTEKAYFQKYAMRDAEIGYYAGKWLIDKFGKIKVSLPSLAFGYFNKQYKPLGLYLHVDSELSAKLRLAYKGGRVESWVRGSPERKEFVYDKVSLYPSVMKFKAFPCGINKLTKKSTLNLCHDGIALCTVKQDAEIPFLCLKTMCSDGNIKLIFPNGVFKSWFTYPELRYFSINGLGKILNVHEAWETQGSKFYFSDYIDEFFGLKFNDKEHADFWKLCMTALYGKFAQDAHSPELEIGLDNSINPIEDFGTKKENFQQNILVSAYVAAFGRIDMHKSYVRVGAENLNYTDTDSLHTYKQLIEDNLTIGLGLGQLAFKLEGHGTYIRSKFYLFNDLVRCRGMQRIFDASHVRAMIERNDVTVMSRVLLRLRSAYRQHKPFLSEKDMLKSFSLKSDCKRVYAKDLNGKELLSDYTNSQAVVLAGSP